jgi:phage terminase large subunit-like protein
LKCQEGYRRIKNLESGGRMQIFAANEDHADGILPTDAFIDELHRHKNLRLYRTWRGKLGKRHGQMATISTAGEPGGEFEETRELIRQAVPVVERSPGFLYCRSDALALHEYAVPQDGDVEDMAVVKAANPFSLITEDSLAAKRATPTMTLGALAPADVQPADA